MILDCATCSHRESPSCGDCVVTFIAGSEPDRAVVIDAAEFLALRRLQSAGLVPELRHDDPGSLLAQAG